MNKDTIVGIVGAVALLAAMVGVFKYEGSQAQSTLGSQSFDLTWTTEDAAGPSVDGTSPLRGATEETLVIGDANITRITFTLTWTATAGADTLKLTVVPPEGSGLAANTSSEENDGELDLVFDIPNTVPPAATVFGNSEEHAKSRLADTNTKLAGTGNWTVTVEFVDATGVVPLPGAPPVQQDQQVSWTVSTTLTQYAPQLAAKSA